MQEKSQPVKMRAARILAASLWLLAGTALAQPEFGDSTGEQPLFSRPSPLGDLEYRAGRGLRLGDTGLTAGGYANFTLTDDEGEPPQFAVEELSALLSFDPHPRLHGFVELELENFMRLEGKGTEIDESQFRVERAYADLHVAEPLNVRVGKFLTPVGRWNVIHAAPLVWTTSRPIATERPFDDNTTGGEVFGSLLTERALVTYRLFGQFVDQLEERPQTVTQERSGGARLEIAPNTGPELGATYLSYLRRDGGWNELGGLDLFWQTGRLEMLGEAVVDEDDDRRGTEWGGYLQLAYEVVPRWFAIGRYEHYDPRGDPTVDLFDLAAAFRPWPTVVLKVEYLLADRRSGVAEPGFKSSFAFMF
jgi:hypothetical protein